MYAENIPKSLLIVANFVPIDFLWPWELVYILAHIFPVDYVTTVLLFLFLCFDC